MPHRYYIPKCATSCTSPECPERDQRIVREHLNRHFWGCRQRGAYYFGIFHSADPPYYSKSNARGDNPPGRAYPLGRPRPRPGAVSRPTCQHRFFHPGEACYYATEHSLSLCFPRSTHHGWPRGPPRVPRAPFSRRTSTSDRRRRRFDRRELSLLLLLL